MFQPFDHQIAGHRSKERLWKYDGKYVIKPMNKKQLYDRELNFYRTLSSVFPSCENLSFFPSFFGTTDESHSSTMGPLQDVPGMILEDVTFSFEHPCLIDIKIGQQTFEPTASLIKINNELLKYPYQEILGFRISGMKVWNKRLRKYYFFDKHFGRSLVPPECTRSGLTGHTSESGKKSVVSALALFFYRSLEDNGCVSSDLTAANCGSKHGVFCVDLLQHIIEKLQALLQWMKSQTFFKFYSSSVLIVYDSDKAEEHSRWFRSERGFSENDEKYCRMKMIDFAHAVENLCVNDDLVPERDFDLGYIYGLTNLIAVLQDVLRLIQQAGESDWVWQEMVDLLHD
jgi:1D-myo-inositol-tetrakisphosphate 5-kinase/inositol-polyphosphate multikinase